MADGYASPLGVSVLRRQLVPPLPSKHSGRVVVLGVATSVSEESMRAALVGHGRTLLDLRFEIDAAPPGDDRPRASGRWHARFAAHEQALAAAEELASTCEGANGVSVWYNERAYASRGWVSATDGTRLGADGTRRWRGWHAALEGMARGVEWMTRCC
jgi:hypothetical protein